VTAIERALLSLEGLSVGDAFGEQFFIDPAQAEEMIASRIVPASPWTFTDDTQMALSVCSILRDHNLIDQDALARSFAARYEPQRGYGPNMHRLLARIREGEGWRMAAGSLFGGDGSQGNGSSMRAAPIGGFFADNLDSVVLNARRSSEVTHTHREGIAGAIAVAVAAAWAWRLRESTMPRSQEFLDLILPLVPESIARERIRQARNLPSNASVRLASAALGNGIGLSAIDTVPFALWCASQHLDNYEDALWTTVSALGDRDTTCAIVGGIVAIYAGRQSIPAEWLRAREPLPKWIK
jgi:ADP-ribosylglycohydrolase